uniref:Uncharacterized protein n=1 Tax=viral metagenome TaxID=1070528 RepID=A0A6M3KG06_9ZZZZ
MKEYTAKIDGKNVIVYQLIDSDYQPFIMFKSTESFIKWVSEITQQAIAMAEFTGELNGIVAEMFKPTEVPDVFLKAFND